MRGIIPILFLVLLVVPSVYSEDVKPLHIVYCQHMGYQVGINSTTNKPMCVFEDGSKCYTDDFYTGVCGKENIKQIQLRKEGESVYVELGEQCAEGLSPSKPAYLLDQPKCIKQSVLNIFIEWIKSLF